MDHIWSPWRFRYVATAGSSTDCVFCRVNVEPSLENDRQNLVVHRGRFNFLILNLFPYSSGHLMIATYAHEGSLSRVDQDTTTEMIELAKRAQSALELEYRPDGLNIGFNLGRAAGAGVAEHLHLHVVPRWIGDANFVSIVGETRVLPEDLHTTYDRIKRHFNS